MQRHQFPDAGASTPEHREGQELPAPLGSLYPLDPARGHAACLACGSLDVSVVGERPDARDRFNACCERCGLLQVTGPACFDGRTLADSRLAGALARARAGRIALAADVKMGDAVLAFGALGAQLLAELDGLFGIDAHVVVDPSRPVAVPEHASAFADDVRSYDPGIRFDAILALHVAQRWPRPLQGFLHLRRLLKPGGTLLVEVPNVLPDGEFDIETFVGAGTTASFSLNTLRVVLLRAGFQVQVDRSDSLLQVRCRPEATPKRLPVPFHDGMLDAPEQTGDWLITRLATYVAAEQARDEIASGDTSPEAARAFLDVLHQPAFAAHLAEVTVDVLRAYADAGDLSTARALAAAAQRALPGQFRDGLAPATALD